MLADEGIDARNANLMAELAIPPKDPDEVTPEPEGPPEKWPIAFMPDGEDIVGNGHVIKRVIRPGNASLGRPPLKANCKTHYTAYRMDGRQWDTSRGKFEFFHFILGDLYVNRVLEAAASSMQWGEIAEFICTPVYAKENNGTQRKLPPRNAAFRYEVELFSWRERQARDGQNIFDMELQPKLDGVVALKERAAELVRHECWPEAQERYRDCAYYFDGLEVPPEREEEVQALFHSVLLNDAMCNLKLSEYRRVEELTTTVLEKDEANVKALYRRGVARIHLHEFCAAHTDLLQAARLDPKSKEVRSALASCKEAEALAQQKDQSFAGKIIGKKELYSKQAVLPPAAQLTEQGAAPLFLDVAADGRYLGRIVCELFGDATPKTAENFRGLCRGDKGRASVSGARLHYKGCPFHRFIRGFMVQAGDIVNHNGTGGVSIYGGQFSDESFALKHDRAGLLSMANVGRDTNASQFFITTAPAPHLDNEHVVFGRVIEGLEVVQQIEQVDTDERDRPTAQVFIVDCGELASDTGSSRRSTVSTRAG